jgi:hypothetical protein
LEVLGLFAKHWAPGEVKTRIAAKTGPDLAAWLAYRLLESVAEEFQTVAEQRWLLYTPPEKKSLFAQLPQAQRWTLCPQASGDLGVRLREFFRAAFVAGAKRVVAIGADCPAMSAAHCAAAFRQLALKDTVIGPATDGGYYLIGLSRPELGVFENIAWSTSAAREQTLQRIAAAGLSCHQLQPLTDLDEVDSFPQIEAELQQVATPRARELLAILRSELSPYLARAANS